MARWIRYIKNELYLLQDQSLNDEQVCQLLLERANKKLGKAYKIELRQNPQGYEAALGRKFIDKGKWFLYIVENACHGVEITQYVDKGKKYVYVNDYVRNPIFRILYNNMGYAMYQIMAMIYGDGEQLENDVAKLIYKTFDIVEES